MPLEEALRLSPRRLSALAAIMSEKRAAGIRDAAIAGRAAQATSKDFTKFIEQLER